MTRVRSRRRITRAALAALAAATVLVPSFATPASAQAPESKPCELIFTGVRRGGVITTQARVFTEPGGRRITYVGGGVDAACAGQGNRLLADSAEHHESRGELVLIRNVRYTEPEMALQSDRMIYYTNEERLYATGSVRGRSANGTRFTGPQFEYLRAKLGLRAVPSWRAPGRPTIRMAPNDTTPRPAPAVDQPFDERGDSTDLSADFIHSENDSLVHAVGNVIVERHDLRATGDSAMLDRGREFARLMREPRIVGTGERPYTLVGARIDLWSREQRLERVLSAGDASVVSDSLELRSDTIDMRMRDQRMERVYAWGVRAKAETADQEMVADSLDLRMPGQRLHEVRALGKAIAFSRVDTARIISEDRDWISGDTLVAEFDTVTTADTTERSRMREVVATGSARAFYQLPPSGEERGAPNISYNRGRVIEVHFDAGEVVRVDVTDRASGVFLEPVKPDSTRTAGRGGATPPRRP